MCMENTAKRGAFWSLTVVMLSFFVMGFVDLVGTASNYIQKDLNLSDAEANLFPSLLFLWFLICAVPTGMFMNRFGRKRTVLLSIALTALSLAIPLFGNGFWIMLGAFSLLGIGNAIMQTSVNPLVANIVSPDRVASTLTFGQFVKACASFLSPILVGWCATGMISIPGLGWKGVFLIYALISLLSLILLWVTRIREVGRDKVSGFRPTLRLLRRPFILLCFIGIMCHAGIDVGTNATAPKIVMERLNIPLEQAAIATSIYFIFRTIGSFLGSLILRYRKVRRFFTLSVAGMAVALVVLIFSQSQWLLYSALALLGLGNANIFSIIFAQALHASPGEENAASSLMVMGIFGATLFPLAMGFLSDAVGQWGAVAVMLVAALYLLTLSRQLHN